MRNRARNAALVWLLRGFDLSTAAGRSRERYRRAALTTLASAGARSVGIVTTLVSIPLTVHYLGTERFGLWATMSSLIVVLGLSDLGLGLALVNVISEAHGRDDREAARQSASSAFYFLTAVSLVLGATLALVYGSIPWASVFNVSSDQAAREAGPAAAALIGCFLLSLPLGVAQRIQMGYQEGFISSLWVALGSLLTLAGIAAAIWTEAGLPWLVLAAAGGPVVAAFFNSVALFGIRRRWMFPTIGRVTGRATRVLLTTGLSFFLLQAAMLIAYQSDTVVIAQVLGPEAVPQYAIPVRVFLLVPLLAGFVVTPLWPAYSESISRGDIGWVRKALRRSLAFSVIVAVVATVPLVAFGRSLVHVWVGGRVTPSTALLIALGLWTVLEIVSLPLTVFLKGAGILRFQAVSGLVMAAVNLPLSIVLARSVGIAGVVYATVISIAVCEAVPLIVRVLRALSAFERASPQTSSLPQQTSYAAARGGSARGPA